MTRELPSSDVLRQLLRYDPETGKLFWRHRPLEMFATERAGKIWNTRFSGKEALIETCRKGYKRGKIFNISYQAHRIIWALHYGFPPEKQIDHINGNTSDNRIANLRDVSNAENQKNVYLSSNNTSGVIGVSWNIFRNKWVAQIGVNKKNKTLGYFDSIADAAIARQAAEKKLGYTMRHGAARHVESQRNKINNVHK